ncbi:Uma2 family endonuclease [Singulisphaera rosea]
MSTSKTKTKSLPRVGPSSAGLLMSPEEFDAIDDFDDRYRYELVRGVLVVSPFASRAECDPNGELEFLLRLYQSQHPQGQSLDATLYEQYLQTPQGRRRPDRVIWAGLGRLPDPSVDVPTIVVEFVSRGRRDWLRDYEEKRREYLSIGVQEYWVIDRFRRTLTVYRDRPGAGGEFVVKESETYRTDHLPGFELPLGRLLAAANRWKESKRSR